VAGASIPASGFPPFADRRDAGARLADVLAPLAGKDTVLLGLMRGGLPVAAQAAAALSLPYAPLAVRKVGHPANPELAIGAVAVGGVRVIDAAARSTVEEAALRASFARAEAELAARLAVLGGPPSLAGRRCAVIDDGLATGLTALAGWRAAVALGARSAAVAAPVASTAALERLAALGIEAKAVLATGRLAAVSRWYRRFAPPAAEELTALRSFAPAVARERLDLLGRPARLELPAGFWRRGVVVAVGPRKPLEGGFAALLGAGLGVLALCLPEGSSPAPCLAAVEALRRRPETSLVPTAVWAVGKDDLPAAYAAAAFGRGLAAIAAPRPSAGEVPAFRVDGESRQEQIAARLSAALRGTGSRPLC